MAKVDVPPASAILTRSMNECIANAERLIDDCYAVEFQEPPATKQMLAMIAQEECAKAFLLFMVRERVIPWSTFLLRAMNDHSCKQLVGVIIEYVNPQLETMEEMKNWVAQEVELGERLPPNVASAISILRHEKIGRWESRNWEWDAAPTYDPSALRIAEGKRDQLKQDALYVRLAKDARVVSTPLQISAASVEAEFERAKAYHYFIGQFVTDGTPTFSTYGKVRAVLAALFKRVSER